MSKAEIKGQQTDTENSEQRKSLVSGIYKISRYIPVLGQLLVNKRIHQFEARVERLSAELDELAAVFEERLDQHIAEGNESLDEPVPPPLDATKEEIQRYKKVVLRQATSTAAGKKGL